MVATPTNDVRGHSSNRGCPWLTQEVTNSIITKQVYRSIAGQSTVRWLVLGVCVWDSGCVDWYVVCGGVCVFLNRYDKFQVKNIVCRWLHVSGWIHIQICSNVLWKEYHNIQTLQHQHIHHNSVIVLTN